MAAATALSTAIFLLFLSVYSPSVNGNFAPVTDCDALVLNLAGCMSFVTIGGKDETPAASCCSGLKTVIDTNANCVCEGLKKGDRMGMKLNVTKAETLSSVCKVNNAPSLSSCHLPNAPANAPAPVPAGGPKAGPKSGPKARRSHGSSLIPISGLSFVASGALVLLFSHF